MPKDKSTGKKLADMMYGNPERAAFGVFPQLGRRGKAKPAPRQADKPFIDERAMELPQFGEVDLDVPTAANRAMGQRMVERDVDLKRQADRDMSPLEKLAGGIQAGRLIGSALTQSAKSIPTAITKGSKAAEDYIAENIYQPTQPKAYEYAGNIADFLTSLESDYKIPPIIPEAMVFQNLVGPATRQAKRGALQAGMKLERGMEPIVNRAMESGGLPREMVMAMGANTQSPMIVYHGSPHKFAPTEKNPLGEFSPKKIGTGEGNQAYGYGHYVAEAKGVAEEYAKNLANRDMANQGRLNAHANAKRLAELAGDPKYAADDVRFVLESNPDHPQKELLQNTLGFLESGAYAEPLKTAGNLYEIDLPDEKIARMLDFDKPLSEQPESVRQAIKEYELDYVPENLTGGRLIEEMNKAFAPEMVATHLRSAGIPGIRYLDEQSRGATGMGRYKIKLPSGEEKIYNFKPDDDALKLMNATIEPYGTQNFVVFPGEEEALNIIDRKKEGGSVHFSDNPDVMQLELAKGGAIRMQVGGLAKLGTKGAAKGAKQAPMKASEALGRIEGRPLVITQADRTKVGGGYLGGPGFSGLQLEDPAYRAAEAAWAVKNPGTAKMILGGSKAAGKDPVYAAMLGTPTQHQSNQMVFDKLLGDFKKAAKKGDLDPELRDRINMRLANTVDKEGNPIFPPNVDILDKKFKDLANTFDRRSVTANLIGGMGVGGKKGQIIDYDKIIRETTDPMLLESPTGALGNRLFTLSGGVIERPDLHPAFPTIMQGEDLGVSFDPVARELIMKDFMERTMREKGRTPGYMDYTRGYPPSQLITEDLLTELQKMGKKAGGEVKAPAAQIDGNKFVLAAQKYGLGDDMATLNKMVSLVNQGATVEEAARAVAGGVRKAAGGEITADDLILEERKL